MKTVLLPKNWRRHERLHSGKIRKVATDKDYEHPRHLSLYESSAVDTTVRFKHTIFSQIFIPVHSSPIVNTVNIIRILYSVHTSITMLTSYKETRDRNQNTVTNFTAKRTSDLSYQ